MKVYSSFILFFIPLVFFSCQKDLESIKEDDKSRVQQRRLVDCNSSLQMDIITTTGQETITASHVAESTSGEMWGVVKEAINPNTSVNEIFDIQGCAIQ